MREDAVLFGKEPVSEENVMRMFASAVLFVLLAFVAGCGPGAKELREKTVSTLNLEADKWDGGPAFNTDASDAYGNPVAASVSKGTLHHVLELRSSGPDALPKNSDDIVVTRRKAHGESTVNKELERGSESIGRGGVRGAIQGAREAFTAKKDKEK
jgi:hypothetical protein